MGGTVPDERSTDKLLIKTNRAAATEISETQHAKLTDLLGWTGTFVKEMEENLRTPTWWADPDARAHSSMIDAPDAWASLKSHEYDLVVTDIQMPRMDGFEHTGTTRNEEKTAKLSVGPVTA